MPIDTLLFSNTVNLLGKNVELRAKNHNLIAGNIANAETPGYTPTTLSFEKELKNALNCSKKPTSPLTNPRHIPLNGNTQSINNVTGTVIETPSSSVGYDKNGVELEVEMSKMVENQILYNASVQILAKKFEGLKNVIKGGQ